MPEGLLYSACDLDIEMPQRNPSLMHRPTMTRPLLLGLAFVLAAACGKKDDKKAEAAASASAQAAPPPVPANVDVKLLETLKEVAKSCEESASHARIECNGAAKTALVSSFNRDQRSRVKALPTFTHVLASSDKKLQALGAAVLYAAFRVTLGPEAKPGSVSPDDARALLGAVSALPETISMSATPALTHAMMLSGQGPLLFKGLTADKPLQVRTMAYRFVMVYGRMTMFDQIKELAKDKEQGIVLAALESPRNMQNWSAEEQDAVCPWAMSFLDDQRPPVASNATALLSSCGGTHLDELLKRVEQAVVDKRYSFVHATSLREMCRGTTARSGRGASEDQCKRARVIQEKAVQSTQLPARVRALTLNGLGSRWPDKQTLQIVKKLKLDAAPEVKQSAERLEKRIEDQLKRATEPPRKAPTPRKP